MTTMVVCMDVSLLFSSDNNVLYEWMCHCCFRVTTMFCMNGCVIVVFE